MVAAVLLLGVGVPPGVLPAGRGAGLPLSGLLDWLAHPVSWAKDPKGPEQLKGRGPDGHYQTANRAEDIESKVHVPGELAKYQANQPKAANVSTGAAMKGFDPRSSKRDASKSTDHTDVFQNADGSYTQRLYEDPVDFKGTDGSWKPIDSNLHPDTQSRPQIGANAFQMSFAAGTNRKLDALVLSMPLGYLEDFAIDVSGAGATSTPCSTR